MENSIDFLKKLFLTCPETDEDMEIVNVRAGEEGLDHTEIICKSTETKWKFRVYQEEL